MTLPFYARLSGLRTSERPIGAHRPDSFSGRQPVARLAVHPNAGPNGVLRGFGRCPDAFPSESLVTAGNSAFDVGKAHTSLRSPHGP